MDGQGREQPPLSTEAQMKVLDPEMVVLGWKRREDGHSLGVARDLGFCLIASWVGMRVRSPQQSREQAGSLALACKLS